MSRSTRASIASSLCAFSLFATGCGDRAPYDRNDVRVAFAESGISFDTRLSRLFEDAHAPPARPLSEALAELRDAMHGTVVPPPRLVRARTYLLAGDQDVNGWIFATTADAIRAERAVETETRGFRARTRFVVRRRANVLVFYDERVERRVRAALDRLGE